MLGRASTRVPPAWRRIEALAADLATRKDRRPKPRARAMPAGHQSAQPGERMVATLPAVPRWERDMTDDQIRARIEARDKAGVSATGARGLPMAERVARFREAHGIGPQPWPRRFRLLIEPERPQGAEPAHAEA